MFRWHLNHDIDLAREVVAGFRSYPVSPGGNLKFDWFPVQPSTGTGNPTRTRTRNRGIFRSLFSTIQAQDRKQNKIYRKLHRKITNSNQSSRLSYDSLTRS